MSRKPSRKPKPGPARKTITVTKELAAISQLHAAIWLWFNYDAPLAILALATQANDCYNALGAHIREPSLYQTWLKAMPEDFQERARYVSNFIKHGMKDLWDDTPCAPSQGETLIVDSIDCHKRLFGDITPEMSVFSARFIIENPDTALPRYRAKYLELRDVYKVTDVPRPEFFKTALQMASQGLSTGSLGEVETQGQRSFGDES